MSNEEKAKILTLIYSINPYHKFDKVNQADTGADSTLVYGELPIASNEFLIGVVNAVRPIKEGDTFYDLGSGFGKVCIHWLCRTKIKKAIGIEVDESRHMVGSTIWDRVKMENALSNKEFDNILGSIFDHSGFGNYVYTNNVMFPNEWNSKIWESLLPDTVLISFKNIPNVKPVHEVSVEASWKKDVKIRIYYKK